MEHHIFETCVNLLRQELIPAIGCTEPIAIAFAAARARKILGCAPEKIEVQCSGNIIKNAKAVAVPGSGGLKGIDISAALGAVSNKAELGMEVLRDISSEDVEMAKQMVAQGRVLLTPILGTANLHIIIKMTAGKLCSLTEIKDSHLNIVREEKDKTVIFEQPQEDVDVAMKPGCGLCYEDICAFSQQAPIHVLKSLLMKQIDLNSDIATVGLDSDFGAMVGQAFVETPIVDSRWISAISAACAGSDARMGGCLMPVVINSGSGNQGMTVSLPVIVFAKENAMTEESMLRALAFSNLLAIYQKSYIGKLSAYCGAVSAAAGAVAGISLLSGDTTEQIARTLTIFLATISGMVCDGAKPSCAAKIGAALAVGFMCRGIAKNGGNFQSGEGIVGDNIDQTIAMVGRLASCGMRGTDDELLKMICGQ